MKVKKSTKRFTPPPADAARLIELITQASEQDLPNVLSEFRLWRYPRGDLHGWIPVMDKFDEILAEVITSHDLSKIQTNAFSPESKTLVLDILRVSKMLLENCTSRKLFSSYDRLCDLMLTNDLDVLHATLSLLMRPAQTYAHQMPIEKSLNKTLKARLITLAKGSDVLRTNGLNLRALSASGEIPLPEGLGPFQVTFYPTQQPDDRPVGSGSSQITIDPFTDKVQEHISQEAEKNFMSVEDQLETHNKVRWILSLKDEQERQHLVAIRLLAIAELWFISADDNSQSSLFLYEPDLITQISELFGSSIPETTQTAAIAALDGCIRSRSRLPDVLTAIGANLSHGGLMSLFRRVVNRLATDEPVSHDIVDAALSFISFISMSHSHAHVLAGAGAIPLLLEMLKTNSERRDNYIPRATGLIDAFGGSGTNNSEHTAFLVERVKAEIDNHLNAILPEPTETLSQDSITFYTTTPLKSVLRSLHRIMHSGVEGSRNMVDTDLPKLLKQIFHEHAKFGHRVFAQAINIMASFVHNEPTSLSILQEQQLPQTLFEMLEKEVPDSFEVMTAVSSAIGAACLNTAGLEYVGAHPDVLTNLVNASISLNESGAEHIQHMGAALDELSRHHPTLRPIVLEAVNKQLQQSIEAGKAFVPTEEEAANYSFESVDKNADSPKTVTNKPMTDLAKVIKLLDGLLGNTSLCKDFIEGGLDLVLQIPNLPCIPVAYTDTDLHTATTSLFRVVGEYDHVKLLEKVNNSIKNDLEETKSLWQQTPSDWTANDDVKKLPSMSIRLSYIADILAAMSFHHVRTAAALMRSFGASSGTSFVADIAAMHRASFREHAKFRVPATSTSDLATALLGLEETEEPTKTPAQFLATRVHAVCTKLFKSVIRLLFSKRGGDAAHRKESEALAKQIAKDIVEHLTSSPDPASDIAAIGLATILLFDERGPEGRLNTVLFIAFYKAGGIKALLTVAERIFWRMDHLPEVVDEKDEEAKEEVTKATAGLRLVLVVFTGLASPYSLVDSSQTHALGSDEWSAHDILVQIRLETLPLIHRVWSASWLPSTQVPVIKAAAKAFLTIMDGQSETKTETVPAPVAHVVHPPIARAPLTADPARVNQLVDMGFPRGAAEQALIRARNNITAATELILSMPHIFQDAPAADEPNPEQENANADDANAATSEGESGEAPEAESAAPAQETGEQAAPADAVQVEAPSAVTDGEGGDVKPTETSNDESAPAVASESNMDVDTTPAVPIREQLNELRASYKADIGARALTLLDSAEDLVFDLLPAFPSGMDGVKSLLELALQGVNEASDKRNDHISSRLRMLAIFMRQVDDISLDSPAQQNVVDIILPLKIETSPRPKWVCALLIFAEAAFAASDAITVTKIGEESTTITVSANTLDTVVPSLTELINTILLDNEATRDELISALRLFVVMSRRRRDIITPEFLKTVLAPFKIPAVKLSGCQPYISMIVRHAFEDQETLVATMRREIRMYLTRSKVTDVNHFVRQMRQTAARDPAAFVLAAEKECTLNDPSPAQSVYHIRALPDTGSVESDPFSETSDDSAVIPIMDLLVSELGVAVQTEGSHTYGGIIVSLLTEVLGSYVAPKRIFVNSLRKQGLFPGSKGGLASVINEIICKVGLTDLEATHNAKNPTESSRRLMLSSWSTSMLVALSCDPGGDLKEDVEALATVRKNLLDVVAKAIKEPAPSDPNARYGRLFALGELVYGLLLVRNGPSARQIDPASMQIAKIMLEKSFVSLLTAASGDVDLNYPGVRLVLGSLLRALDHLTKVSIKWSKSEKSTKKSVSESESESGSEDYMDMDSEDDEEEGIDQQTPDLYMNSALGMNRVDEDDDEDEEDGEDDEMMDDFDEEDVMTDDDSNTEPSTDEHDSEQEEWMDEEMDGDEDEMDDGPDVVIGDAELMDDDQWDDEIENDEDGDSEDDPEMMDEMYPEEDGMFDDIGEELDMDDMDEEQLEEMELLEARMPGGLGNEFGTADPGHWGWEQGGESQPQESRRSRMLDPDRAAAALLGLPSRSNATGAPAQPALISQVAEAPTRRRDATTRGELFAALQGMGGAHAVQLMETLLHRSEQAGAEAIRISFAQNTAGTIDITVGNRSFNIPSTNTRAYEPTSSDLAAECVPKPTDQRWLEEMKLTPIQSKDHNARLVVHLVNRLLPEAKKREADEAARRKKEEEEEVEREKKDEEEEAAKAKKEEMAGLEVAAGVELPASRSTPAPAEDATTAPSAPSAGPAPAGDVEMTEPGTRAEAQVSVAASAQEPLTAEALIAQLTRDLLENTQQLQRLAQPEEPVAPETSVEAPVPEGSLARTIVSVRGHDVDITDTGIDLEFLQALPEDMRADVIEQHLREQTRARQPPTPSLPADLVGIEPEFLNALPPDIRREVIAQQAMEHARRQRPAAEASAPAAAAREAPIRPTGRVPEMRALRPTAGEMPDTAFLNTLPSELRDVMMMDNDEAMEAMGAMMGMRRTKATKAEPKATELRDSIQLLEKPGIASLTRLLFFPESFKKERLFRILANLCENSTSRSDLLNLLLSVLQDGSGDLPLVDRSFQQMSIKALATPAKSASKAKVAESPAPFTTSNLFSHLQTDNIPTFIAQRCLEALAYILGSNAQAVNFFLTEHEQGVGLKKPAGKKGKGKEKLLPQTKFPVVILLGLLDRTTLLSTPGVMESLTALLVTVTKPLATLKVETEESKEGEQPAQSATTAPSTQASTVAQTPGPASTAAASQTPAPAASSSKPAENANKGTLTRFPVVPTSALRLVVNCLTTGECSSRNFSQTAVVLQNLSCIPEASKTILQELQDRSQKLGQELQEELHTLSTALNDESFDTSTPALTVFSSPAANQAQLLRLLKTIEYLHLNKVDSDPPGEVMTKQEQAVSDIYQSFDFDPMWNYLRQCLTLVEQREDAKQIALVLLPLVEALMVVCKYRRNPGRQARSPSVPPSSAVSASENTDLFLSFTTHHRKILNTIVRTTPALLSGSFSLLIHNPKVLEFDNKRQWFFQKLKKKREQVAAAPLNLLVRRQNVLQNSFDALKNKTANEVKYGKLTVKFEGEDGIDAGGVTREWFSVLAKQIFDPNSALFEPCAADQLTYQPNKASAVANVHHLEYFRFVGRIIGKAVYDGRLLDAYFNRAFYKQILGRSVDMRDLESIDPEYHKSLQWMLENDITGVIDQEFTIEDEQFGEKVIVELKDGGAAIPVTEENKEEYVSLVVSYRLDNSIKDQIKAFLEGFYDIIPRNLIQIFEPDQLELLISGMSSIDVDELRNATQVSGWKSSDPEIGWFWRALRSFSQEERSRFLMFVTSSSRVPLGGFTKLIGASGIQPFQLQKLYSKEGSLPQASTCFNLLLLPQYSSYEQLRDRLQFAVTETGGFGKA